MPPTAITAKLRFIFVSLFVFGCPHAANWLSVHFLHTESHLRTCIDAIAQQPCTLRSIPFDLSWRAQTVNWMQHVVKCWKCYWNQFHMFSVVCSFLFHMCFLHITPANTHTHAEHRERETIINGNWVFYGCVFFCVDERPVFCLATLPLHWDETASNDSSMSSHCARRVEA